MSKLAALCLIPALLFSSYAQAADKPIDPAVMKQKIVARGLGNGVRVDLKDRSRISGVILRIDEESFQLKPRKALEVRDVRYDEVRSVRREKMSTGKKVGIGLAIVGGVMVVLLGVAAAQMAGEM